MDGFDEADVFFDGGLAVLDGEVADDVGVFTTDGVPAPLEQHLVRPLRLPVVGVQNVAWIDLEGDGGPKIPGGVVARILIRLQVDGIGHILQVLTLGCVTQAIALGLDVVGGGFNYAL